MEIGVSQFLNSPALQALCLVFYALNPLTLTLNPLNPVWSILSPFYKWGNWDSEVNILDLVSTVDGRGDVRILRYL